MALHEGCFLLVRYNVPGRVLWHSRLVVAPDPRGPPTQAYIVTPDNDEYTEDFALGPDVVDYRLLSHWKAYPAGIGAAAVYEFDALPSAARCAALGGAAYVEFGVAMPAQALNWFPQVAPAAVALAPVAPVAGGPAGGLGRLVAALGGGAPAVGLGAPAPAPGALGAPPLPAPAAPAVPVAAAVPAPAPAAPAVGGGGASGDVRVLDVSYDSRGIRHKDFREAVNLLVEHAWPDWKVVGPRTVLWLCQFFVGLLLTPMAWFTKFRADAQVSFMDEGIEELERNCRLLETAVVYDQLNVADLASFEMLARSIQVTAYSFSERFEGTREDSFERGVLFGTGVGEGSLPICPKLKEFMAAELQKKNAVDKEKRKAQETRALLSTQGGQGGRGGRGGRGGKG